MSVIPVDARDYAGTILRLFELLEGKLDDPEYANHMASEMSNVNPKVFQLDPSLVYGLIRVAPRLAEAYIPFEYIPMEDLAYLVHKTSGCQTSKLDDVIKKLPSLALNKPFAMKVFKEDLFFDGSQRALLLFPALRDDPEVVKAAIKCGSSLMCVSEMLKHELDVVLAAVERDGENFNSLPPGLQKNKQVVLAALKNNVQEAYLRLDEEGKRDPELMVELVQHDHMGEYFKHLPDWAQKDEKLLEVKEDAKDGYLYTLDEEDKPTLAKESLLKRKREEDDVKRVCKR